jgi:hypothetical protein
MVQAFLIGIGAGAASALLFASVASGAPLSVVLFYLAPLPILIAAIGWSHWAGLVAALTAAGALGTVFSTLFFLAFLFGVGLPAWWLGYLTLLARPAPTETGLEWYPPGHLVFWAALLGAVVVVAAIPNFGLDEDSFNATLRAGFERVFRAQTGTPAGEPLQIPGIDVGRLIDVLVVVIPPAAAALTTATLLINLWLAARIVRVSGRLKRAWPDLPSLALPTYGLALLAAAIAGTFLPGLPGIVAGLFAASFLVAYAVLGFAVVHTLTRPLRSRPFVLGGIYAAVAVFGWPGGVVTLLGIADAALDLRGRSTRGRAPPTSTNS